MAAHDDRIEASGAGGRRLRALLELGAVGDRPDGALLARFVAGAGSGDRAAAEAAELAFGVLVERHGGAVLRAARAILGDEAASLDASQATFLLLAERARSLRVGDTLAPWLVAVARRVALGVRRAEARRARHERAAARPEAVAPAGTGGDQAETVRVVLAEVAALPEPYRLAVAACHLDGLTQHAAAARLGWPVGTLQSRLDRGRRRLHARLARRGFTPNALGLLPPAGLSAAFPPSLVPPLARLAAGWATHSAPPSALAPGVLAALHAAKGTAMIKLVPLTFALLATAGLAIAGGKLAIGPGDAERPTLLAQATPPGDPQAAPTSPDKPAETLKDAVEPGAATKLEAGRPLAIPFPEAVAPPPTPSDDGIPPPVGTPTLLFFHAAYHEPSRRMAARVAALAAAGYPVRTVDINNDKRFEANYYQGYKAHLAPVYFVVAPSGEALARADGVMSTKDLADFYNKNAHKPGRTPQTGSEPALTLAPELPRPWETAARLKFELDGVAGEGKMSGTVIWSDGSDALILTNAYSLLGRDQQVPDPKHFGRKITVDLFDGKLAGLSPARVGPGRFGLAGTLVAIDAAENLALVQIHPGTKLPAAPLVPDEGWAPAEGANLLAVGCSEGADATTWNVTVLDPTSQVVNSKTGVPWLTIKATPRSKIGREGGGLFTPDGHLLGVCSFHSISDDPKAGSGDYTRVAGAHWFLRGRLMIDGRTGMAQTLDQADAAYLEARPHRKVQPQLDGQARPAGRSPLPAVDRDAPSATVPDGPQGNSEPLAVDAGDRPPAGPAPTNLAPPPRLWETTVRIQVHLSDTQIGLGSGTVIASTAEESIILTCAHTYRDETGKFALDRAVPRVTVDLFGNQFTTPGSRQLPCVQQGIAAELVALNTTQDFALIRIRPGRVLAAAPIAPAPWAPIKGMDLVALGCSRGEDATVEEAQVLDPRVKMLAGNKPFYEIKCSGQPAEGRSGGGLFTRDGYLVGVCNFADPRAKVGLYCETRAIRSLGGCLGPSGGGTKLDLAAAVATVPGLKLVANLAGKQGTGEPAPAPAVSQEQRLSDLERKLDRVLESLDNRRGADDPGNRRGLTPFQPHGGLGP